MGKCLRQIEAPLVFWGIESQLNPDSGIILKTLTHALTLSWKFLLSNIIE